MILSYLPASFKSDLNAVKKSAAKNFKSGKEVLNFLQGHKKSLETQKKM